MASYSYHLDDDPKIATVLETTAPEPTRQTLDEEPGYTVMPPILVYMPSVEITQSSLDELASSPAVYNRELAWLDFNWRVLAEAQDERNPLLERLRFLAITASNLDEFFRKRVGGLKRQQAAGAANLNLLGWTPDLQIQLISQAVHEMMACQSKVLLNDLLPALKATGVALVDYEDLSAEQQRQMRDFFHREIYPILTPLAVDPGHPFPLSAI